MNKLKKPLLFTLALLPFAAVAGYFMAVWQFETLDPALLEDAVSQLGSLDLLVVITVLQTIGYAAFCGFTGYLLADNLGLIRPFRPEKKPLVATVLLSLAGGILFSLDYWTFGAVIDGIRTELPITLNNWIASILYGGVIEELMLRLFMMSLIGWLIRKIFFRKSETVPAKVLIAANVIAALLFAAGHLPATYALLGGLTPLVLFRCFLLNGGFGLLFGELYRRHGIQYAMLSHALLHIVSKLIWTLFA